MAQESSARLLALLGLFQSRTVWTGTELAERLGVSARTVRNDIDRLRRLDYPVDAVRGRAGHYRLGIGAKLPPLLLDDDEAVAITVGLAAATGISGIEETSTRALTKLEGILPHRLRRQVDAVRRAVSAGPENTGSNVPDPEIAAGLLTGIAAAIRDLEEIRFDYRDEPGHQVQPYRLISWQRRWYLVGRTARTDTWSTYRLDWMRLRTPGGPRFTPVDLPGGDYTAFVLREVAFAGWTVHARIRVAAPADRVVAQINPAVGVVEAVDEQSCVLVTGADSVEILAVYVGMLGMDFAVDGPPELVEHLAVVGGRYLRAVADAGSGRGTADQDGGRMAVDQDRVLGRRR
jgi:predicted DNA-binding transcriptional regulator YafY